MHETRAAIECSVIAPARNEQANIRPLIEQIVRAMETVKLAYEIVIVDDGSTDDSAATVREMMPRVPPLRLILMQQTPSGCGNGQSAAFHAGFRVARGEKIALLDADLQNDPADIPALLERMRETGADLVQGDRTRNRNDSFIRQASSWVGWFFRRILLGDTVRDTGCSLRVMKREVALALPLEFRGMHRFIPITARQLGYTVVEVPVSHRARTAGVAKYGIWNRALPGLIDCFAVRWMRNRRRPVCYEIVEAAPSCAEEQGAAARTDSPATQHEAVS